MREEAFATLLGVVMAQYPALHRHKIKPALPGLCVCAFACACVRACVRAWLSAVLGIFADTRHVYARLSVVCMCKDTRNE